jgi:hypothetical protein
VLIVGLLVALFQYREALVLPWQKGPKSAQNEAAETHQSWEKCWFTLW